MALKKSKYTFDISGGLKKPKYIWNISGGLKKSKYMFNISGGFRGTCLSEAAVSLLENCEEARMIVGKNKRQSK